MKRNLVKIVGMLIIVVVLSPVTVMASTIPQSGGDLVSMQSGEFENLIEEILSIKENYPEYTEEMILEIMNERHSNVAEYERGIVDIWNALTDSEKNCVFDILLML